jgi:proteasome lid subunit RPN8/RPN11
MTGPGNSDARTGRDGTGSRLLVTSDLLVEMIAHCLRAFPEEGCGLIAGELDRGLVRRCYLTRNVAGSARLYTVDPGELLRADRDAEASGWSLMGVFHSHTHTDPYPSPTDVAQAPDPGWHYVLVSLRDELPSVRSYRIVDGAILEEPILVDT